MLGYCPISLVSIQFEEPDRFDFDTWSILSFGFSVFVVLTVMLHWPLEVKLVPVPKGTQVEALPISNTV